jgi:hypothetical protein
VSTIATVPSAIAKQRLAEESFWEYRERFPQLLGRESDSQNDALRVSVSAAKSGLFGSNYPP